MLRTIIVDDELLAMELFEQECRDLLDIELLGKFDNCEEALGFARTHLIEFALLDIHMPGMNGIELGCALKELHPDIIIIYLTGYSDYVVDTMRIKADYCIMKPYDRRDIYDAVMRVKLLSKRFHKRMRIVTFGTFEVYVDDRPLHFGNSKAKELLALCADREGGVVSMETAIDMLWPERFYDEKVKRLYRKSVGAIQSTLEAYKIGEVFVNKRGSCHLVRDKVECDLFQFLDERTLLPEQRDALLYQGYLPDYSWGELRNARFSSMFLENAEKYI